MNQLIETDWLKKNINNPQIKIIDGTWYMPGDRTNGSDVFKEKHIPNAIFIDLEEICDINSDLPHMMPNEIHFSEKISSLGICNKDHIIIYDMHGMFSAARIWFMFKAFGHDDVSLLNGGFPAWLDSSGEVSNKINNLKSTIYKTKLNKALIADYNQVLENLSNQKYQVLDARSHDRFSGISEEPRPGMKSGHIPKSKNLYFNDLIDQDTKKFVKKEEIENLIKKLDVDVNKGIICSCGSGVTACIIKFAIELISKNKNIKIYDGSWSEWGTIEDSPYEKN